MDYLFLDSRTIVSEYNQCFHDPIFKRAMECVMDYWDIDSITELSLLCIGYTSNTLNHSSDGGYSIDLSNSSLSDKAYTSKNFKESLERIHKDNLIIEIIDILCTTDDCALLSIDIDELCYVVYEFVDGLLRRLLPDNSVMINKYVIYKIDEGLICRTIKSRV